MDTNKHGFSTGKKDFEQKGTKETKALGRRPNATGETPVPPGLARKRLARTLALPGGIKAWVFLD
jgi:hypothetical protein